MCWFGQGFGQSIGNLFCGADFLKNYKSVLLELISDVVDPSAVVFGSVAHQSVVEPMNCRLVVFVDDDWFVDTAWPMFRVP